jgi:hypothetical protein
MAQGNARLHLDLLTGNDAQAESLIHHRQHETRDQ